MNRRYPVTFRRIAVTPVSDFKAPVPTPDDILVVQTGGMVRDLTLNERDALTVAINQDGRMLTCNYTPELNNVSPGDYTVELQDSVFQIMGIDRREFSNRKISFIIGRNA